eukprot:4508739-Prymnesium_polylepis.1
MRGGESNRELTVGRWITLLNCHNSQCRLAKVEEQTIGCLCIAHCRRLNRRQEQFANKKAPSPLEFRAIPDGGRPLFRLRRGNHPSVSEGGSW